MGIEWHYEVNPGSPFLECFTPSQLDVIARIANGQSYSKIADERGSAIQTVKNIVAGVRGSASKNCLGALGVFEQMGWKRDITLLVCWAITQELLIDQENAPPIR